MHAWVAHLARLAATATPAVLVTVAATRGSTPRAPGARMIVTFDGSSHGSIGGGRLEQRQAGHAINQARHREILSMLRYAAQSFELTIPQHWL